MNIKNIGIIAFIGGGLAYIMSTFRPSLKYHSETKPTRYAVAVMAPNDNGVTGVVHFEDTSQGVVIKYNIEGLADGEHGFHIHEYGDLTDGCQSACAHFNPFGTTHGGLDSAERHEGDLGNITSTNGKARGELTAPDFKFRSS